MRDIIIIGAGVTGCAIARELSRYQVDVCVLEKCEDVCCGTSKANSAIIHAGFDAAKGSLMAKMNVLGNQMMPQLAKDLDIPFIQNGSMVVCMNEEDLPTLQALYDRGIANGVKELRLLNQEETLALEPNLSEKVIASLYAPTAGIVCPFSMTIAFAENANSNGVDFMFGQEVISIEKEAEYYKITTNQDVFEARYVVNAAGVYADRIHNMVSEHELTITPRRGDYCLLDKSAGSYVKHTIFPVPSKLGKGVLVAPTVHGNLIVGPTAIDIDNKEGTNTTKEGLDSLIAKAGATVKKLPINQVITSFSGLRAHEAGHEFIIEEIEDAKHFIDAAGIESPGLTSAPAIGCMVADLLKNKMNLVLKKSFIATRKGILNPALLGEEERNALIHRQPAYGTIVCRCESISEGEILEAIHRPLGARSLDGIKRRTRAGMGRCQAGFCTPRVMEILSRELNLPITAICKNEPGARIVSGQNKDWV